MINIIVLMAGSGHRFRQAGYKECKPMIDVCGKPMIEKVIENLTPKYREHSFIFVTLSSMADKRLLSILRKPNSTIIELPYITEGATCSALKAEGLINNNPLIIASCDQLVDIDIDEFIDFAWASDGCLLTFPSDRLHCSFTKTNKENRVVQVAEKKVISRHANIGIYWFKQGNYFIKAAKQMIQKNIRTNNEFYVAPVYNEMLDKKITIYEIKKEQTHLLGTPDELNDYIKRSSKNH